VANLTIFGRKAILEDLDCRSPAAIWDENFEHSKLIDQAQPFEIRVHLVSLPLSAKGDAEHAGVKRASQDERSRLTRAASRLL
jgi:hypothetical protein